MKKLLSIILVAFLALTQAQAMTLSVSSQNNVTCFSGCNGSASVTATGGTAPYTYNWSPAVSSTNTATGLCAGSYTCTVTDATAATASVVITITQPSQLTSTISPSPLVICAGNGGTLTNTVSGGTGGYMYSWAPASGLSNTSIPNPYASPASTTTYTCTVTDLSGCSINNTVQVVVNPLPNTTINASNTTVCAGSPVTLSCIGAATYVWMPGNLSGSPVTVYPTATTTYSLISTSAAGCSNSSSITINVMPSPTVTVTGNTTICSGGCTALTASGAQIYQWQPGSISGATINACPLTTTTYTVTGTNSFGCSATQVVTVYVSNGLAVTPSPASATICIGSSQTIGSNPSGGVLPYSYIWNPSSSPMQSLTVTPTTTTSYTVWVTDAYGCMASAVMTVYVDDPQVTGDTIVETTCNGSTGQAWLAYNGNYPASTYAWNTTPQQNNYAATGLSAGNYTCTITTVNGCVTTGAVVVGDSCDFVWPGDANDDAIADMNDFLAIGVANGATGTTRPNASIAWIGQPSAAWGQTLLNGTDYKWGDCDGNGVIDQNDTMAVHNNYGLTHNNRFGNVYTASAPDLKLVVSADSLGSGTTGTVSVLLGDAVTPAQNIYGVSFRLNYDVSQIVPGTVGFSAGTSWLGTLGSDMMVMHVEPASGMTESGLVRLDHQNRNGSGQIAQMPFRISSALTGTGNSASVAFWLSNVQVISANETPVPVNTVNDTVTIVDNGILLGLNQHTTGKLLIYPNPARESFTVQLPAGGSRYRFELYDLSGRMVYSAASLSGSAVTLNRSGIEAGIYESRIISEQGKTWRSKICFE